MVAGPDARATAGAVDAEVAAWSSRALLAVERQRALVAQARTEGRVGVTDAARVHDVTAETIRRDLDALERLGLLRRVHGGAIPVEHELLGDRAVAERDVAASAQKEQIARAALQLVSTSRPGAILLDSGTTTARLAALLVPDDGLTVFTNSPVIATVLAGRPAGAVELSGGRVRGLTQACVGADAVAWLQRLRVDTVFLGTNGLSLSHGLSTPDAEEAAVKAAMVHAARRVVVLADSRKFGVETARSFCRIEDVDVVVTDAATPEVQRQKLAEKGIEVLVP